MTKINNFMMPNNGIIKCTPIQLLKQTGCSVLVKYKMLVEILYVTVFQARLHTCCISANKYLVFILYLQLTGSIKS